MKDLYKHPSFLAHAANGILLLLALILVVKNFASIKKIEPYSMIMLILVSAAVIGIHGISHLGLEKSYGFDPIMQLKDIWRKQKNN